MRNENNGMAKGLLIGFLAGGIVGAVTALLYAPKPGRELRTQLKQKATDFAEDASEYVRMARTKTNEMISKGKERSDHIVSDVREKADTILGDAEKVLSGIRERAGAEPGRVKTAFKAGVDAYKAEKDRDHTA